MSYSVRTTAGTSKPYDSFTAAREAYRQARAPAELREGNAVVTTDEAAVFYSRKFHRKENQ